MIHVILADDHHLFREGVAFLIKQMNGIVVTGEAANYEELMPLPEQVKVDVLLLDLDMPGEYDGIAILKETKIKHPDIKVIILTMHGDIKMMSYLMELGASSYLLKDTNAEELEAAIEAVYSNGFYFNKLLSEAMISGLKGDWRTKPKLYDYEDLTSREGETLLLIIAGLSTKEIANKLFISQRTAEGHRNNLMSKLGVNNTASLIVKAIKLGLVEI